MPNTGLSKNYVAKRNYDKTNQAVSYTQGRQIAYAVKFSADIETSENNNFRADNAVIYAKSGDFKSGKLNIESSAFSQEDTVFVLGLDTSDITIDGKTVKEVRYGGNTAPEMGFGTIKRQYIDDQECWQAIILPRICFNIPKDDVATEEGELVWQTENATANIMREQQGKKYWQYRATFETEEEADAYIRRFLGISEKTTPAAKPVAKT